MIYRDHLHGPPCTRVFARAYVMHSPLCSRICRPHQHKVSYKLSPRVAKVYKYRHESRCRNVNLKFPFCILQCKGPHERFVHFYIRIGRKLLGVQMNDVLLTHSCIDRPLGREIVSEAGANFQICYQMCWRITEIRQSLQSRLVGSPSEGWAYYDLFSIYLDQ